MPELPEVETVRQGLERKLCGARVSAVTVRERRLRIPLDVDQLIGLVGRTVRAVRRRAKYLLLDMEGDLVWMLHLGMSGRLLVVPPEAPVASHEHFRVSFERAGALAFRDPRRFGLSRIGKLADFHELHDLGPEPLDRSYDAALLAGRLRATRRDVKATLLDQRVIAGIGNIYASEILFRAGVRPTRRGNRLSRAASERIASEIPLVLTEAVERRGTSFSDYFDIEGIRGTFQDVLWVFDRHLKPCRRCSAPIRRHVHGGRSSFFCPTCQS